MLQVEEDEDEDEDEDEGSVTHQQDLNVFCDKGQKQQHL